MPHTVPGLRFRLLDYLSAPPTVRSVSRLTSCICNLALGLAGWLAAWLPDWGSRPRPRRRIVSPDKQTGGTGGRTHIDMVALPLRPHQSLWWELNVYAFCLASSPQSPIPSFPASSSLFNERPAQYQTAWGPEEQLPNQRAKEKYNKKHSHRIKWYPWTD